MTKERLEKLEQELLANGYKKYTHGVSSNNDIEYVKGIHYNPQNEQHDTLVGFRVWDFSGYGRAVQEPYSLDVNFVYYINERVDVTINNPLIYNLKEIEGFANKFYHICKQEDML